MFWKRKYRHVDPDNNLLFLEVDHEFMDDDEETRRRAFEVLKYLEENPLQMWANWMFSLVLLFFGLAVYSLWRDDLTAGTISLGFLAASVVAWMILKGISYMWGFGLVLNETLTFNRVSEAVDRHKTKKENRV